MKIGRAYASVLSESIFERSGALQPASPHKKHDPTAEPEFHKIEKQLVEFWKKWSFDAGAAAEERERRVLLERVDATLAKSCSKKS